MAEPIPGFEAFCVQLSTGPGELCILAPGGVHICAQVGYDLGDPGEITRSLFAQVNSFLAPLAPFFLMLDFAKSAMDCIKAIPDSLGPPPDPTAILRCLPKLIEAVEKLIQLLPPLSIPVLIKSILDVLVVALLGLRSDIARLIEEQIRIHDAALAADTFGLPDLNDINVCAQDNLLAYLQNKNSGMAPLNRLIGAINFFMHLAGLPCIPTMGSLLAINLDALKGLDFIIDLLMKIKAAIPGLDFHLPAIPGPDDPC